MLREKPALPPGLPLACLLLASAAFLTVSADQPPVKNETGVSARWRHDTRNESSRHVSSSGSPGLKSLLSLVWHSASNLRRLNHLKGTTSVVDDENTLISNPDKSVKAPLSYSVGQFTRNTGSTALKSEDYEENYEQLLKIPREIDEDVVIKTASNLDWHEFENKRLEDDEREAHLNVHPESKSLPVAKVVAASAFLSPRSHDVGKPMNRNKPSGMFPVWDTNRWPSPKLGPGMVRIPHLPGPKPGHLPGHPSGPGHLPGHPSGPGHLPGHPSGPGHPPRPTHRPGQPSGPGHPPRTTHRPGPGHPPRTTHRPGPGHPPRTTHRPGPGHPPRPTRGPGHPSGPGHPPRPTHRPGHSPRPSRPPSKPETEDSCESSEPHFFLGTQSPYGIGGDFVSAGEMNALSRPRPSGCQVPDKMHIPCGPAHVTPEACLSLGCCADSQKSVCFYPLEACTKDSNFVFVVYRNSTWPEINLHTLRVGQEACPPLVLTEDFALFKFGLGECGTSVFEIGSTSLFIAEVLGTVVTYSQAFGEISRQFPYNFKMQCSYSEGSLVSLGYIVKTLPPQSVVSHPIDPGVQLRVAKDKCYTQYYPETGLPLRLFLGSSLYLELCLLNPPEPDAKLLVNYCIAYPRSSEAAWVLIYNGCPNTLDPSPSHLQKSPHNHCRRFEVKTFQFVDRRTKAYLDEEIYILCSTEICSPIETSCDGACFDHTGLHVSRLLEEEQQHSTEHIKGI